MFDFRVLLLVAVTISSHGDASVTKPIASSHFVTPKTTLELFTQLEPELNPWWLQRIGDDKPLVPNLPNLNMFGSGMIGEECITLDQCISRRLYNGPMFIVTKDPENTDELTAYFTEKGFHSIFKDVYKGLNEYLRTSEPKSAILFNSRKIYNFKMANRPINRIVTPEDFKLMDLDLLTRIGDKVPVLFITDKEDFERYRFSFMNHFGKFNVFNDRIEPDIN